MEISSRRSSPHSSASGLPSSSYSVCDSFSKWRDLNLLILSKLAPLDKGSWFVLSLGTQPCVRQRRQTLLACFFCEKWLKCGPKWGSLFSSAWVRIKNSKWLHQRFSILIWVTTVSPVHLRQVFTAGPSSPSLTMWHWKVALLPWPSLSLSLKEE